MARLTLTGAPARALLVALLAATSSTGHADTEAQTEFVDNDFLGEQAVRSLFAPEDFTIDFSTRQQFSGGLYQPVSLSSDPLMAALTTGFVQAVYSFEPCGVVFPHVHPRGDENVFVVSGTVDVGFVDETGALIRNPAIKPGNGFVIPQGYIHYLANPTCGASQALATVPAADGGSYGALGGVFALPENILLGAVPFVDKNALPGLRKAVADSGVMYVDAFCAAKCADLARGSGLSRADSDSDRRAL